MVDVDLYEFDLPRAFVCQLVQHGPTIRQGPHHTAQKSTSTGTPDRLGDINDDRRRMALAREPWEICRS